MPRIDYRGRAGVYERERTLPPAVLAAWDAAIQSLALPPAATVLDLGAGPGGFLDALTTWSEGVAIAVEPSSAMRARAQASGATSRHPYTAGLAEQLPLRTASVDLAWLSTVVHQFDDRDVAARELARVVRPGGLVLIRGFLSDVPVTGLLAQFPGVERSAASFPSTDAVVAAFAAAGFSTVAQVDVVEPWRFPADTWADRLRSLHDSDSALRPLTVDELEDGIASVLAGAEPGGTFRSDGTLRLLVLRAEESR